MFLKESVEAEQGNSKGEVLNAFMDVTMKKVQADKSHTDAFFQDYLNATKYIEEAIVASTKPNVTTYLESLKGNFVAMFINSGVADCESLQNIYGPQVEENKADSAFLKKAISVLKMMKCTECEAYFKASDYAYKINPTADAAVQPGRTTQSHQFSGHAAGPAPPGPRFRRCALPPDLPAVSGCVAL